MRDVHVFVSRGTVFTLVQTGGMLETTIALGTDGVIAPEDKQKKNSSVQRN